MVNTKQKSYLTLIFIFTLFFAFAITAYADHEAMVAGEVVPLADVSLSHGENCDDIHYHGELNGKTDPNPDGCGHGVVAILSHDEEGESVVPKEATETDDDGGSGFWSGVGEFFGNVVDVVLSGMGIAPPKTVHDAVDIVEDSTPSIKENKDNIERVRETTPPEEDTLNYHTTDTEGLKDYPLSKRFFDWVWGN